METSLIKKKQSRNGRTKKIIVLNICSKFNLRFLLLLLKRIFLKHYTNLLSHVIHNVIKKPYIKQGYVLFHTKISGCNG